LLVTVPVFWKLGSEFMPPLDEGSLLYMPSTMPGISVGEAQRVLQYTDGIIKGFPEVDRVLGKAGRAETATDPAPLSMSRPSLRCGRRANGPSLPRGIPRGRPRG
jgi:Cu(I)/Ag(I) efflux system membrane protein CusA/SilA